MVSFRGSVAHTLIGRYVILEVYVNTENFLQWLDYAIPRVGNGYFGHAERVYCYELYHHMRVAMEEFENENGELDGVFLHSELVKAIMPSERAQVLDVIPLRTRRMPDFIFHSPGNFERQIAAIEVKTTSPLSFDELCSDLIKLSELRTSYHYQLVIFHCVNTPIGRVYELIQHALNQNIELDPSVLVVCKPDFGTEHIKETVGDIIERIT
ncbi:hypothetical protein ACS87_22030 [Vibrio parahaemolyticus]|uniref:hypothetical protein n=1 Tax=Vibrio parahaemolyticus TaxID=670 RepID=UPI0006A63043|nr:hypothetical protein [Vibrio parahaemolyticus]KOE74423.1 hypothetical protein ACS87_22030 [Vibrio parahaemolyticus]